MTALARFLACVVVCCSTGCIDFWAAYGNEPAADPGPSDPHDPGSLARSLLTNRRSVVYTDDGERYAVHRCRRLQDEREICDLAFGLRASGIDDIWPVFVDSRDFDRGGRRAILDLLEDRLDDLDAHGMLAQAKGKQRVMVDGGHGRRRFVVEWDGTRLQLGFSETASATDARPLAAVTLERGRVSPEIRAVASRRRRDLVAVEIWADVDEPAVAAYNAWVLFFLRPDGRWISRFVRPVRDDVLYCRPADLQARPVEAAAPAPPPSPPAPAPAATSPLRIVPAQAPESPPAESGCQTDADCEGGRRCCANGVGVRGCHEPLAGACPKLP